MAQGEFGDNNFLTGFLINTLNPATVYEYFTYISGVAAVVPWLIVIFGSIRIAQEAAGTLSGKAALAEAMGDASKTLLVFLAYSSAGLLIFVLLFALAELFEGIGSSQLIHTQMVELRRVLMADSEAQRDWFELVLGTVADVGNVFAAGLVWGIYQFLSVAYVSLSRLIDVMFAIGLVLTYAWGFIAIPTMTMKGDYNLVPGFSKTLLTFAIWLILEPLLLFFVWLLSLGAVDYLAAHYSGGVIHTTAITLWYLFSCVMMSLVLIMKIIAPFLAMYLARNDSMVGALGAAPAVLGTLVANQVISKLGNNMINNELGGMMPNDEGSRLRDSLSQGVSDTMHTPLGQLFGGGGSNDLSGVATDAPSASNGPQPSASSGDSVSSAEAGVTGVGQASTTASADAPGAPGATEAGASQHSQDNVTEAVGEYVPGDPSGAADSGTESDRNDLSNMVQTAEAADYNNIQDSGPEPGERS